MIEKKRFQKVIKSKKTRNRLWESNHQKIIKATAMHLRAHGNVPTNDFLIAETGLSRKTICKHLNNFATDSRYIEQMNKFKVITQNVLGMVFQRAMMCEDMKAAKIFLNAVSGLNGIGTKEILIQNQNNFIQINNTVISQESLIHLKPEQRILIEEIFKTLIPQQDRILSSGG